MRRALALQVTSPSETNALWARVDREVMELAVWVPYLTPRIGEPVAQRVGNTRFHPLWGPLVSQMLVR